MNQNFYARRTSLRLRGIDYGSPGVYFITVCTHKRECNLSFVKDTQIELTDVGKLVKTSWLSLPDRFSHVKLDYFVIMPNHIHAIVNFIDSGPTLGTVIGGFKS